MQSLRDYTGFKGPPGLAGVCSLTQRRRWSPEVYATSRRTWGIEPDPQVSAFSETYETVRADLEEISASA